MTDRLRAPVPAPANRQPRVGLIALAERPDSTPGDVPDEWVGGFSYVPEPCGSGQVLSADCAQSAAKTTAENPRGVHVDPVMIVAGDDCTTLDVGRDGEGRAQRHLRSIESHQLEKVLWTGVTDDEAGLDPAEIGSRPSLTDGNAVVLGGGDAHHFAHAVALMDQALTGCLHGSQGMLHVTPYTLARLAAGTHVVPVNGRWLTPNGHLVVAGSGYTGGAPRPEPGDVLPDPPDLTASPPPDQWIYGTGMVSVLLGPAESYSAVDRNANRRSSLSERPAAAFWGWCCHYAAQVTFHTPEE